MKDFLNLSPADAIDRMPLLIEGIGIKDPIVKLCQKFPSHETRTLRDEVFKKAAQKNIQLMILIWMKINKISEGGGRRSRRGVEAEEEEEEAEEGGDRSMQIPVPYIRQLKNTLDSCF